MRVHRLEPRLTIPSLSILPYSQLEQFFQRGGFGHGVAKLKRYAIQLAAAGSRARSFWDTRWTENQISIGKLQIFIQHFDFECVVR
jgi:hypothetical protein